MATPFIWHPNDPPPELEQHSWAKLQVLRKYLRSYFDTLGVNPARDEFRLDLVDGFAGGGAFRYHNAIEVGTPLIMLEEANAARERLNTNRAKPLLFNCKFHFVDLDRNHTAHLRKVLSDRGYRVDGEEIVVHDGRFEDKADEIIAEVQRRQPRSGRAIFLLDQTGFSQVQMELVHRIFRRLPADEVVLTFAADALTNLLADTPQLVNAVAPLEFTHSEILDLMALKDGAGGRALVQRAVRERIRSTTGATYDTPFFIRPQQSRRALWFLHLSRHPTARDVMIRCHWDSFNTFEHYGSGDFDMLGWDALNTGTLPLFHFEELEAVQLREQLLRTMPSELYGLAAESPVTVDTVRHVFANRTAARFSDLSEVILTLGREREVDVLTPEGKLRSRSLTRLNPTDLIAIPNMRVFPAWSRLSGP